VRVSAIGETSPPDAYHVAFRLRGVQLKGDQPVLVDHHEVEIRLPVTYPREKPVCVPLTPIFHPNIKAQYCLQDHWAAGQSLVDIITRIGDMIQYREFNVKSPLNAVAARWARENPAVFPLGNVQLDLGQVDVVLRQRRSPTPTAASATEVTAGVGSLNRPSAVAIMMPAVAVDDEFALTLRGSHG
jgi:Ubiquitin-conjugating enzyme